MSLNVQVRLDGLSFNCRVDGRQGKPWLMFSNSLLTNLSLWDEQVAALDQDYRILRYDQRGHGGTQTPPRPTHLDELVADALALLDYFDIAQVTVIGVSMGAATALCLAAREPDRVVRAVGSDGQAATAAGGAATWQERIDFALAHDMEAVADATVGRWMTAASVAAGGAAFERCREMVRSTDRDGFIACARALQGYDFLAELPNIRQPTLLIAGEKDGAMPRTMQAMQRQIPNARYVEIPAAGHLPNLETPDAFNSALLSFLREAQVTLGG